MFRLAWLTMATAFFMMTVGACKAPEAEENPQDGGVVFHPLGVGAGQDERELEKDETFCMPSSEGQTDWRQCAFDTTSGSRASYVASAVPMEDFALEGFSLESPFTPAIAHLPDGPRLLVGVEWFRSTGLWCGLIGGGSETPGDCPEEWFRELRDKPLSNNPILGELDGRPGLDLFVVEIGVGSGGPAEFLKSVAATLGTRGTFPDSVLIPHFFTYSGGLWQDVTLERGFEPVVMPGKLAVGFEYIDLDGDGMPEIATKFMAPEGGSIPVWRWNTGTEKFDLRTDMVPTPLKVSFYGYFRGPTSPEGESDFFSVGSASEVLAPGEMGTTCWRGKSLATAQQRPCPLGVFGGSPMGMAIVDTRGDGCPNWLTSDVGLPGYCEKWEGPFEDGICWENPAIIPMTQTDWGDEPISWAVASADFNGDGWQDVALAHSWHRVEEHWNQQLVLLMNDGQGNFLHYRDSETAAVKPFGLPAQERTLIITSAGDAPPDLMSFSINREGVEGAETERYLGNPFIATAQMERVELRGPTGAYACGAFIQAYRPGDEFPTLIGAPCTGGYGGFYPPQVWVPATTERITVLWTDGSTTEVLRAETATDGGFFPQIIQAD